MLQLLRLEPSILWSRLTTPESLCYHHFPFTGLPVNVIYRFLSCENNLNIECTCAHAMLPLFLLHTNGQVINCDAADSSSSSHSFPAEHFAIFEPPLMGELCVA